jgi:hypothetical protein
MDQGQVSLGMHSNATPPWEREKGGEIASSTLRGPCVTGRRVHLPSCDTRSQGGAQFQQFQLTLLWHRATGGASPMGLSHGKVSSGSCSCGTRLQGAEGSPSLHPHDFMESSRMQMPLVHRLVYPWDGWPSGDSPLPLEPDLSPVDTLWLADGLRRLGARWTEDLIQMTFEAAPDISPVLFAARVKGRLDQCHACGVQQGVPRGGYASPVGNRERKILVQPTPCCGDQRSIQDGTRGLSAKTGNGDPRLGARRAGLATVDGLHGRPRPSCSQGRSGSFPCRDRGGILPYDEPGGRTEAVLGPDLRGELFVLFDSIDRTLAPATQGRRGQS